MIGDKLYDLMPKLADFLCRPGKTGVVHTGAVAAA